MVVVQHDKYLSKGRAVVNPTACRHMRPVAPKNSEYQIIANAEKLLVEFGDPASTW